MHSVWMDSGRGGGVTWGQQMEARKRCMRTVVGKLGYIRMGLCTGGGGGRRNKPGYSKPGIPPSVRRIAMKEVDAWRDRATWRRWWVISDAPFHEPLTMSTSVSPLSFHATTRAARLAHWEGGREMILTNQTKIGPSTLKRVHHIRVSLARGFENIYFCDTCTHMASRTPSAQRLHQSAVSMLMALRVASLPIME